MSKQYYVYILTNFLGTTFYIGVTSDLERRLYEHKNELVKGFTSKYNLSKLVYFETTDSVYAAISREKQLKRWHRQWKINLIREMNPEFNDFSQNWERSCRVGTFCSFRQCLKRQKTLKFYLAKPDGNLIKKLMQK